MELLFTLFISITSASVIKFCIDMAAQMIKQKK
jgi:hypothetical protein